MVNELLINLVNKVLGVGKRTARGNQSYHCPFCNHHKPKLEVNFTENPQGKNPWACWACGQKGTTIKSLFKNIQVSPEYIDELKKLVRYGSEVEYVKIDMTELLLKDIDTFSMDFLGKLDDYLIETLTVDRVLDGILDDGIENMSIFERYYLSRISAE